MPPFETSGGATSAACPPREVRRATRSALKVSLTLRQSLMATNPEVRQAGQPGTRPSSLPVPPPPAPFRKPSQAVPGTPTLSATYFRA